MIRTRWREAAAGYALSAPFLVLLGAFVIYPIVYAFRLSFQDFSYLVPQEARWIGLDNYRHLLHDPTFRKAMRNTLLLTAIVVPTQTLLALLLANALSAKIRARGLFRTLYFLPYVVAPIAVGAVMVDLFGPGGLVTRALHAALSTPAGAWYTQPSYAFVLVVIVLIWSQLGFFTLLYLAGLQAISPSVYEAARIDGASSLQILRKITIPLLRPMTFLVVVMGVIISLQVFEQPYAISTTGGALPGSPAGATLTMVMYLYTQAFRYFDMGSASAAAFVVFVLIVFFAILQALQQRRARSR